MAENNRNRDQASRDSAKQNQDDSQSKQTQNTSGETQQDQNSQHGSKWSNYQTRELSDEGYTEENLSDKESA